jgi:hypothetical protein
VTVVIDLPTLPSRVPPSRLPGRSCLTIACLGKSHAAAIQKQLNAPKLRCSGRQLAFDDSPKGCDMTPIEFRDKKTREIQELLEKISSLDGASFSSENKDRLFQTYQRQLERLTIVVSSPSLERLCSG